LHVLHSDYIVFKKIQNHSRNMCGGEGGDVEREYGLTAQQRKEIFQTTNLKFRFPFTTLTVSLIVGLLL